MKLTIKEKRAIDNLITICELFNESAQTLESRFYIKGMVTALDAMGLETNIIGLYGEEALTAIYIEKGNTEYAYLYCKNMHTFKERV